MEIAYNELNGVCYVIVMLYYNITMAQQHSHDVNPNVIERFMLNRKAFSL